jgi:molybdopterin-containing oxidoreductase family iron-sulfur binding subunit
VRRFNWFDWTKNDPPELQAARNPEVTVRGRGVMEKCTYCIQRLQNARIDGEVSGDSGWAANIQTACQQACPTQAIVFGDVSDPASPVNRRKSNGRNYNLLEEANTRPRTTYSARIVSGDADA